jgi:hypothetical protein
MIDGQELNEVLSRLRAQSGSSQFPGEKGGRAQLLRDGDNRDNSSDSRYWASFRKSTCTARHSSDIGSLRDRFIEHGTYNVPEVDDIKDVRADGDE